MPVRSRVVDRVRVDDSTPTPSAVPTLLGAPPPSVTAAAIYKPPTFLPGGNVGAQDFTPGAVPTVQGGDSSATITPSPVPTTPALPLYVPAGDVTLFGTYYAPLHAGSPAVLLLPEINETRSQWDDLASHLQAAGYGVLSVDLRGYGDTGNTPDWTKAPADSVAALAYLQSLPGSRGAALTVISSGIGANLALGACAINVACKNAVLISPRANDQGVSANAAIKPFGSRGLLIITSAKDDPSAVDSGALNSAAQGSHQIQRYPGKADGLALLSAHSELDKLITDWLGTKR